jgi:predicted CXXCH cytochrome family protein
MVLGCDPAVRYRVLSFFFDGVPRPDGLGKQPQKVRGPWGIALDPDDPRAKEFLAKATTRPAGGPQAQEASFIHKPYKPGLCQECHSAEASYQVPAKVDTCRKCHQQHYATQWDDWAHGPAALSKCNACHLPHLSKYAGLLTMEVPGLCFSCHDAPRVLSRPYHADVGGTSCSTCHDPHMAGNRLLLVDSGSYARRARRARILPSGHSKWEKETCMKCHVAEKSNEVLDNVDAVCLSCHEKVRKPAFGKELHEPIVKGKCIRCHRAHRSPIPKLIRPEAEKNCLGCHKLERIQNRSHPSIQRADCLLCHAGHSSGQKYLLNPIGVASRRRQPAGQETTEREAGGGKP